MVGAEYMMNIEKLRMNKLYLLLFSIVGIGLMGIMALKGGEFGRTFNDIPALLGYGSLAILICHYFWRIFSWLGSFSYEWYLTHILTFSIIYKFFNYNVALQGFVAMCISICIALVFSSLRHVFDVRRCR